MVICTNMVAPEKRQMLNKCPGGGGGEDARSWN